MQTPVYSAEEARTRDTFLALMWALSYPGRTFALPAKGRDAFLVVAETLLDLETTYFTSDQSLALELARTGARSLPPDRAQYHFYPELIGTRLQTIAQASTGTMLYPDRSATLIIGCELGSGRSFRLSGPGIAYHTDLKINLLPDGFWELRGTAVRYPLGWDVFLVSTSDQSVAQVVGLPRSTVLEKV